MQEVAALPGRRSVISGAGAEGGGRVSWCLKGDFRFRVSAAAFLNPGTVSSFNCTLLQYSAMEEDTAAKGASQGTSKAKVREVSCITFSYLSLRGVTSPISPFPHLPLPCLVGVCMDISFYIGVPWW